MEVFIPNFADLKFDLNSQGKTFQGFINELRFGIEQEKFEYAKRQAEINRVRGAQKTVDGLGQAVFDIDARTYFRWAQQEQGCWEDKQFVHEFLRDNPECRVEAPVKNTFGYGD